MKHIFILLIYLYCGSVFGGGWEYLSLPSAKHYWQEWDYLTAVEHKTGFEYSQSDVCLDKEELLNSFPEGNNSNSYWNYINKYQQGHTSEIIELGSIQNVNIYEIVHYFKEPIDYIKILAFSNDDSNIICPFTIIADWNWQMIYARSEIVKYDGINVIHTTMQDHVVCQGTCPTTFYFTINNGLPKRYEVNSDCNGFWKGQILMFIRTIFGVWTESNCGN